MQEVITLPLAKGGLGIPLLREEAPQQYAASKEITDPNVRSIIEQSSCLPETPEDMKKPQQSLNAASQRSKIDHIDNILPSDPLPSVNQAKDKGASLLLTSLPPREQGLLALNKQEFRDSLRMGHNLPLEDLPSSCTRGSAFSVNHALYSCKKGGLIRS